MYDQCRPSIEDMKAIMRYYERLDYNTFRSGYEAACTNNSNKQMNLDILTRYSFGDNEVVVRDARDAGSQQ